MPKRKIDRVKLGRLLREGKSQREIAQVFGVTEGAISKAKGELSVGVIKVAAMEHGHELVSQHIDAGIQLFKINKNINNLLNEVSGDERITERFTNAVQAMLEDKGSKEDRERIRATVGALQKDRDIRVKCSQEIRGQLGLQWEITKGMVDVRVVAEFQREVLEAVAEVAPDVRNRIVNNLKEKRALRGSISIR